MTIRMSNGSIEKIKFDWIDTVSKNIHNFVDASNNNKDYLEPPYENHYIIVRRDGFLIDGLRRACVLLYNGNTTVPVAILK